jgi:hypothetical protein
MRATSIKTRLGLAIGSSLLILGLSIGAAAAGEVNGNGESLKVEDSKWGTDLHARSFCAYSGQNDNPASTDPMNPGGRVQSYGYSIARNHIKDLAPTPAQGCNPNAGFEE